MRIIGLFITLIMLVLISDDPKPSDFFWLVLGLWLLFIDGFWLLIYNIKRKIFNERKRHPK